MTQVKSAQGERGKSAWRKRAGGRTLAQRRADLEAQVRRHLGTEELMALTDLSQVKARLKDLHRQLDRREGRKVTQYEIADSIDVPHRTFQSWENAEVETEGRNYDKLARFYTERLGREVTRNYILFGQDEAPEPSEEESTPDVLGAFNGSDHEQLDRVEWKLNRVLVAMGLDPHVSLPEGADPGRVFDAEPLPDDVPEPLLPSERDLPETSEEERPAAARRGGVRSRRVR
jgi:transcriptional regulator with XRE-family HTH domain